MFALTGLVVIRRADLFAIFEVSASVIAASLAGSLNECDVEQDLAVSRLPEHDRYLDGRDMLGTIDQSFTQKNKRSKASEGEVADTNP